MDLAIRTFGADDFGFASEQTAREGWDATAELFELCLAHDPGGSFVAEAGGQRVGMVTTTCYQRSGWIGNLIVPPEHRRQGIGERLMKHALEHLLRRGVRTIRLEADPPGIGIYRRLGFVDEFESPRFVRPPGPCESLIRPSAQRLAARDLPAVADFDAQYFGDRRDRLIALLFEQSRTAYGVRERDALRGYVLVVPSRAGIRLGPCVAADREAAEALLASVLADWSDKTILLGVPAPNTEAPSVLRAAGFRQLPACLRMIRGEQIAGGRPETVYAIANGAMG